jgi:hypothetical protein
LVTSPKLEAKNDTWGGVDVQTDKAKGSKQPIPSWRFVISRIPWARYQLVVGFAILALLAGTLNRPNASSAAEPPHETLVAPSPTPVQVTPPPKGTGTSQPSLDHSEVDPESSLMIGSLTRIQSWLMPYTEGISIQALGIVLLLIAVTLFFLYIRRRRRPRLAPLPTSSVPFLKSSDGDLFFRLDSLEKGGLIIGRGRQGVDLRIAESTPFVNTVSNRHARVYYDATCGNVIIEDLDSTNGIFINGRRAPGKNLLKDGWVLGLGSVALTYHDGESDTGPLN